MFIEDFYFNIYQKTQIGLIPFFVQEFIFLF